MRKEFALLRIVEKFHGLGIGNVGLKCLTDKGVNVVFWGTSGNNTRNIDYVSNLKFPVKVECDYYIVPSVYI